MTGVAAVVFGIIEYISKKIFLILLLPVCKVQSNLKEREMRSKKAAKGFYKCCYFMFSVSWGYYVLKDTNYLPRSLGGSGDIVNSWIDVEAPTHVPGLKMYGLVTMGYHVGGLVSHTLFEMHRKDYIEMMLHHIVAFYLFFGYYMANVWEIGTVIAFLHDIADITTSLCVALSETRYQIPTLLIFLSNLAIWAWTRLYVLPFEMIYHGIVVNAPAFNKPLCLPGFVYLLSCMVMLHAYWFYLFICIFGRYTKTGVAEDT